MATYTRSTPGWHVRNIPSAGRRTLLPAPVPSARGRRTHAHLLPFVDAAGRQACGEVPDPPDTAASAQVDAPLLCNRESGRPGTNAISCSAPAHFVDTNELLTNGLCVGSNLELPRTHHLCLLEMCAVALCTVKGARRPQLDVDRCLHPRVYPSHGRQLQQSSQRHFPVYTHIRL